jgi:hypothetical protein
MEGQLDTLLGRNEKHISPLDPRYSGHPHKTRFTKSMYLYGKIFQDTNMIKSFVFLC